MEKLKTLGISPKAILALLFPLVAALGAALASWALTGNFNDAEVRTAISGAILSVVSGLGAYIGAPGNVVANTGNDSSDPATPPGMIH